MINLFLNFLNAIFFFIIYIKAVNVSVILNFNFYLKVDKVLKYIFLLNIYINIIIFRIIVSKIIKVNNIININKGNVGSICIN